MIEEIRRCARAPLDLDTLPNGLAGYYGEYWGNWRARPDWDYVCSPLLGALAAALEPATERQLSAWAGLPEGGRSSIRLLREEWSAFVSASGDHYILYHASLRRFLVGQDDRAALMPRVAYLVDEMAEYVREAHARIADHYRNACSGDWSRLTQIDSGYGLRHLADSGSPRLVRRFHR